MIRAFRHRINPVVIAWLAFQSAPASAEQECRFKESGFRYLIVEENGLLKEYRLEIDLDRNIKIDSIYSFHGGIADFYCKKCFEQENVVSVFKFAVQPDRILIDQLLKEGLTFPEFTMGVRGRPREIAFKALGEPERVDAGLLRGEIASFSLGPDKNGDLAWVANFYLAKGCANLLGVIQGSPVRDFMQSFAQLKDIVRGLQVLEVEVGSTSRELSPRKTSDDANPARKRSWQGGPVRLKPFTLDDLKPLLQKR